MRMPDAGRTKEKEESMISMFRYLMGHLEPGERRAWRILMFLSLISPAADVCGLSAVVYIVNRAVRAGQAEPGLVAFAACMSAVSVLKCLFELYKSRLSSRIVWDSTQRLSVKIYETLIKEDLYSHTQKDAIQALAMVRQDTISCIQMIQSCIEIWISGMTLVGYTAVLVYVSRWAGLASGVALILLMIVEYGWTRDRIALYGEKSRIYSIRASAQVTIAHGSFKEMKIDDRSGFVLEKYRKISEEYVQVQSRYQYESTCVVLVLRNSTMCVVFAVLTVVLTVGSDLPDILMPLTVYITALVRIIPVMNSVLSQMYRVDFAREPFVKLKEALTMYESIKREEKRLESVRRKTPTFCRGLSVQDLTFGYPGKENLFEHASIEIPVGGSIAIIGVSGVGKTTFLDLILGLLKPREGRICFDDYDIVAQTDGEGCCKANLGQLVSYIPQTIYLNGETVRHNVAFFAEEEDIDDARVEECLKCAQIWEDVQKMPEGVDTLIGENGTAISGGQRQRIALARALYKDFELLVMDEATAALDMETERAVIDSIRQIRRGKTLLMVTHHMSLASECDIIYKIEDKKIVKIKGS